VALRLLEPGDADAFLAGFSDPVVHENTYGGRLAPTREAVEAYLARVDDRLAGGEALILAVLSREDGSFLGTTLLFGFEAGGRAEIGFWLGSNARGRGLGKATIELTLRWGFEELGVRRIEGLTAPDNQLSQRAMARAGMVRQPDRDGFVVYASELD
jgi:ribosomal-protein-alanine N-acetyltransferase